MKRISSKLLWIFALLTMVLFTNWAHSEKQTQKTHETSDNVAKAVFAGGCFWCMEPPFDKLEGVVATVSGYTGGHTENPTYKQVSSDTTGHFEAVEITYEPNKINYTTLLKVFWHNVDPLDAQGQFCDKGNSYRTAIFYLNEEQQKSAITSLDELTQSSYFEEPIVTEILPAKTFYPAEEYHQDYYQKNPLRYKYYRFACGRDNKLNELWGALAGKPGALIPMKQLEKQ